MRTREQRKVEGQKQEQKQLGRRDVLRIVPVVVAGSALAGLGGVLLACTDPAKELEQRGPFPARPTDDDEFVPPEGEVTPTNAGDAPPTVPNPVWEARAKQLEDEQLRLYGPVFTKEAPGIMVGKDRSHVPVAASSLESGLMRVTVLVQHVMGKNGLDAGYVDAADADVGDAKGDADAADAARADAADGGNGGDGRDGGDASAPEAGTPQVHYITTMYLRADVDGKSTVVGLWEFASTDAAPPSVKFTLPTGVTSVVAYEWCTLHGLWKAAPLGV